MLANQGQEVQKVRSSQASCLWRCLQRRPEGASPPGGFAPLGDVMEKSVDYFPCAEASQSQAYSRQVLRSFGTILTSLRAAALQAPALPMQSVQSGLAPTGPPSGCMRDTWLMYLRFLHPRQGAPWAGPPRRDLRPEELAEGAPESQMSPRGIVDAARRPSPLESARVEQPPVHSSATALTLAALCPRLHPSSGEKHQAWPEKVRPL